MDDSAKGDGIIDTLRNTATEFSNDTFARYAEQAADQIERFTQRLRSKDVTSLLNDIQQLSRRQPALFIGGAFALGFIGARFLKGSSHDRLSRDVEEASMSSPTSDRRIRERRGFAQSSGQTSYGRRDVSRVHDYQPPAHDGEDVKTPPERS